MRIFGNKWIKKGKQKDSKQLRKNYLNPNYLKTLKSKSTNFNIGASTVKELLEDGQITIKEANTYLKEAGYKKQTINKILRPFKEIELKVGDDFVAWSNDL